MERFCAHPYHISSLSSSSSHGISVAQASRGDREGSPNVFWVSSLLGKLISGVLTSFFAMAGCLVGAMTGAVLGQATESGIFRGAVVGAISGAVFAIEVFDSSLLLWQSEESGVWSLLYMIDIISSLLSGRLIRDRIDPVMFSAVETQMNAIERIAEDVFDIFEVEGTKGLSADAVNRLPVIEMTSSDNIDAYGEKIGCSVCLQDFQVGETVRSLPHCRHKFHLPCIDNWLVRHGSCPLCRRDV